MTETVRIGYARLFDVRVLHHYWLDHGTTRFDDIADATVKRRRVDAYDVRRLLAIRPSRETAGVIAGLRGVFRASSLGFFVAVPDDSPVPLDASFEFFVTVEAADYANYTALTLRPQQVTGVTDPATDTVHRYKANVPVLSNLTGAARTDVAGKRLFLSREYPSGSGDGLEALFTSGGNLRQLAGDPPGASSVSLGTAPDLPVYVHQGDIPAITPPPGSSGAPARGVELTGDTPPRVAAVIRLAPVRPDDPDFTFVDGQGLPRTPTPVYEVHILNRSSTWRYRHKGDGSVTSIEPDPLPLTYSGNAGTKHKPSTAAIGVEVDTTDPQRITRLVSDIYV